MAVSGTDWRVLNACATTNANIVIGSQHRKRDVVSCPDWRAAAAPPRNPPPASLFVKT